jgi:diaminopimelate epimerase
MTCHFTKMHGLGNDFIVINATQTPFTLTQADIKTLSRRDTGIGFDQCLVLETSNQPGIDFFYRIFNANGTPVGQCGNGARCLARFIQYHRLSSKTRITVATTTTKLTLQLNPDDTVTVDMGCPVWEPSRIPFNTASESEDYELMLEGKPLPRVHALALGNPHAILIVRNLADAPVATLGPQLETHANFPEHTNVGFLELDAPNHIKLRVHERGAGETQACGSGAAAAAAVARRFYGLDETIRVSMPGGELWATWPDVTSPLLLTGPASFVYEATLIT